MVETIAPERLLLAENGHSRTAVFGQKRASASDPEVERGLGCVVQNKLSDLLSLCHGDPILLIIDQRMIISTA